MWTERIIPENVQAVEDFKAGKITEKEMWQVINRNIGINLSDPAILKQKWETKPLKGDLVTQDDRVAVILFRTGDAVHIKWFDTNEREEIDICEFENANYTSKGGRTRWYLEDI